MHKIQEIFKLGYHEYCSRFNPTMEQNKTAYSIMNCKSGKLGCNISICDDCGHLETHMLGMNLEILSTKNNGFPLLKKHLMALVMPLTILDVTLIVLPLVTQE